MKKGSVSLVMVAGIAACAPIPPVAEGGTVPGQTATCINLNQVAGRRILPDGSLLFEANGAFDYRNRFAGECPGAAMISRSAVISVVKSSGSQLCRGDRVRVFDPVEVTATGIVSAPTCILADFEIIRRR